MNLHNFSITDNDALSFNLKFARQKKVKCSPVPGRNVRFLLVVMERTAQEKRKANKEKNDDEPEN